MTLLLYFVSFMEVFVLLISATVVTGWVLFKLFDGFVGIYLAITQPETRRPKKPAWDSDPNNLKRAGQW